MAYFYHTVDKDFSISDNTELNISYCCNKLRRMTSATEFYCVHILSGSCHLDINGRKIRREGFSGFDAGMFYPNNQSFRRLEVFLSGCGRGYRKSSF